MENIFEVEPSNLMAWWDSRLRAKVIRFVYQCDVAVQEGRQGFLHDFSLSNRTDCHLLKINLGKINSFGGGGTEVEDYQELILYMLILIYHLLKSNNMLSKGSDILPQKLGGKSRLKKSIWTRYIFEQSWAIGVYGLH